MPKPNCIELPDADPIPILYEDRSVLAIDKPVGWMLVPVSWQKTNWNLQTALISSIAAGDFWARSRNLKFLKYIHRLDAETSGVLLLAKSQGGLHTYADLFETRKLEKVYLAVSEREPKEKEWRSRLSIGPDPKQIGRMIADPKGKEAETAFRLIASAKGKHLIEARPFTGRTHQIRVHLAKTGCPILGDEMYGRPSEFAMGLRAIGLAYKDPFTRKPVAIRAPLKSFLADYGFGADAYRLEFESIPPTPPRWSRSDGEVLGSAAAAKPKEASGA